MPYVLLILLMLARGAFADELAIPNGEILLTVSGNIALTNSENGAEFDLEMLEGLGSTSFVTETPWTDGKTLFEGVKLERLLDAVGAQSDAVRVGGLDSYWYDIVGVDFARYPVVLAYRRDGELMTVRTLGPLWLMFPFDDFPELFTHKNKAASVWQLTTLVVR